MASGCHLGQHRSKPKKFLKVYISGIVKMSDNGSLQGHWEVSFPILLVQFEDWSFRVNFKLCRHLEGSRVNFQPVALQSQSEPIMFGSLFLPCKSAVLSMSPFKYLLFWCCLQWCHDWQWLGWHFLCAWVHRANYIAWVAWWLSGYV